MKTRRVLCSILFVLADLLVPGEAMAATSTYKVISFVNPKTTTTSRQTKTKKKKTAKKKAKKTHVEKSKKLNTDTDVKYT